MTGRGEAPPAKPPIKRSEGVPSSDQPVKESTQGPQRLLIEQRDQLLRSLDQVDQEHEAGDLNDNDHQMLADGYTARLAGVLRHLDSRDDPATSAPAPARINKSKVIVAVALLVFSLGAGFLLARASGERGVRDQISGGIDGSSRNRVSECQELGSSGGDLVGALECFDEILAQDSSNAEALSYRGWYLLLAAGSLQTSTAESGSESESDDADELIASGLSYLDRAIEADPTLPDPLAFRATVFDRLGQSELVCQDIARLLALDPPEFFVNQTAALGARNGC